MNFWENRKKSKVPNLLIMKQIKGEPKTLLRNQKSKGNDRTLYFSVE